MLEILALLFHLWCSDSNYSTHFNYNYLSFSQEINTTGSLDTYRISTNDYTQKMHMQKM